MEVGAPRRAAAAIRGSWRCGDRRGPLARYDRPLQEWGSGGSGGGQGCEWEKGRGTETVVASLRGVVATIAIGAGMGSANTLYMASGANGAGAMVLRSDDGGTLGEWECVW